MKRTRFISAILVLPLIYILTGCYPKKIDYVDEYDVAVTPATHKVEGIDYSKYTTFSLIDTIVHATEDGDDDPNLSRDHDELILSELRQNMLERGYTEIQDPDSITNRPDLFMAVGASSVDYYYYYSWYPYYWGWYPYWPYSYSASSYWWGYPGWGYPTYGGSYSFGTVIVDLWDTNAEVNAEEFESGIIWTGVIDGLLSGSSGSTAQRVDKQINQLFIQSPYLQK